MVVFHVMIDQMISHSDQKMQSLSNPVPSLCFNSKQMLLMISLRCTSSVIAENYKVCEIETTLRQHTTPYSCDLQWFHLIYTTPTRCVNSRLMLMHVVTSVEIESHQIDLN